MAWVAPALCYRRANITDWARSRGSIWSLATFPAAWRCASASVPSGLSRSAGVRIAGPNCRSPRGRQAVRAPLVRFCSPSAHSGRVALSGGAIRTDDPASVFNTLAVFRWTRGRQAAGRSGRIPPVTKHLMRFSPWGRVIRGAGISGARAVPAQPRSRGLVGAEVAPTALMGFCPSQC